MDWRLLAEYNIPTTDTRLSGSVPGTIIAIYRLGEMMRWFEKGWWMVTAFMIECTDRYVTWDRGYAVMWMSRGPYHDLWESWEKRGASPTYIPLYTCWRKFCPISLINLRYRMRRSNRDAVYKYNDENFRLFSKLYISSFRAFSSKLFEDFLASSDRDAR